MQWTVQLIDAKSWLPKVISIYGAYRAYVTHSTCCTYEPYRSISHVLMRIHDNSPGKISHKLTRSINWLFKISLWKLYSKYLYLPVTLRWFSFYLNVAIDEPGRAFPDHQKLRKERKIQQTLGYISSRIKIIKVTYSTNLLSFSCTYLVVVTLCNILFLIQIFEI